MPGYLLHAAVFFAASFAIGLTGYGFGLVAMGVLPFFMDVASANALVALLALPVTVSAAIPIRRAIDLRRLRLLIAGAVIGVPLGVLYLVRIDESILRITLGAIILLAVAVGGYGAWRARRDAATKNPVVSGVSVEGASSPGVSSPGVSSPREPKRAWWRTLLVGVIGVVSGSFGGAFSVSGPPVVLYLNSAINEKRAIKATLVAYFTFVILSRIPFLVASGILTQPLLLRALLLLPVVAAALIAGTALHNRLPSRVIRWIIQLLLTVSAITLLTGAG